MEKKKWKEKVSENVENKKGTKRILDWFDWVGLQINHFRLFNPESCLYIYTCKFKEKNTKRHAK